MSWGERSCIKPCRCPERCVIATCNVDCLDYRWDGKTKPDSISIKDVKIMSQCPDEDKDELNKYLQFRRKRARNELCHCGSGKKYKYCCLNKEVEK